MSINKKAVAEIDVQGGDRAAREFDRVGAAGKKAGKDIQDAFKGVGQALATFGASVVDAVVDVKQLDPSAMVRSFEDYNRSLTRTAIATGQHVKELKERYQELSRANAVLPQSIDAFAKSVGRMTYDLKGAQDAFTGMHNAALAFNESDQEQVGFATYLKNVQGVAGDTTAAVGKLFAQAEKLGTSGGARALRDLFISMGGEVDRLVTRVGDARAQTEGFQALLTRGATGPQAQRIAAGALGFLGGAPLDIQRTLGRPLFDAEGRYKDPIGTYQSLYELMKSPVSSGGRGMDEERILLAFQANLGMEAGSAMYRSLRSGQLGQARALSKLGPSGAPAAAAAAYLGSDIGQLDASRVRIFEEQMELAEPMFNLKTSLSSFVGEHPLISLGAAYSLKAGLSKVVPKLVPKLAPMLKTGMGIAGAVLPIEDLLLPDQPEYNKYQNPAGTGSELSQAPLQELIKGRAMARADGINPDANDYGGRGREVRAAEDVLRARGLNPAQMSVQDIAAALKQALESSTLKVEVQETPAKTVEADKDPGSRN